MGLRTEDAEWIQTRGFPNLYILNGPQGNIANNSVQSLQEIAIHLGYVITKMTKDGKTLIEPTQEAEDAFSQTCYDASVRGQKFYAACTPGWMSAEGSFVTGKTYNTSYPGGPLRWADLHAKIRADGKEFEGFDVN